MSDSDVADLGPTGSVHEILETWFMTTDITEQTHTDAVCRIVEKARQLERELAEAREERKRVSIVAASIKQDVNTLYESLLRERDQWRDVAEKLAVGVQFMALVGAADEQNIDALKEFEKLKEASRE